MKTLRYKCVQCNKRDVFETKHEKMRKTLSTQRDIVFWRETSDVYCRRAVERRKLWLSRPDGRSSDAQFSVAFMHCFLWEEEAWLSIVEFLCVRVERETVLPWDTCHTTINRCSARSASPEVCFDESLS